MIILPVALVSVLGCVLSSSASSRPTRRDTERSVTARHQPREEMRERAESDVSRKFREHRRRTEAEEFGFVPYTTCLMRKVGEVLHGADEKLGFGLTRVGANIKHDFYGHIERKYGPLLRSKTAELRKGDLEKRRRGRRDSDSSMKSSSRSSPSGSGSSSESSEESESMSKSSKSSSSDSDSHSSSRHKHRSSHRRERRQSPVVRQSARTRKGGRHTVEDIHVR